MNGWSLAWTEGGTERTLFDWGFKNPRITFNNLTRDILTLQSITKEANSDFQISYGDRVILKLNGAPKFTGWMVKPTSDCTPGSAGYSVEFAGPWWFFETTQFLQDRAANWTIDPATNKAVPTLIKTPFLLIPWDITEVGAELDPGHPHRLIRNIGEQIDIVAKWIQTATRNQKNYYPFAIDPSVKTSILTRITMTNMECQSGSEVIMSLAKWVRDLQLTFDHTTDPPTLSARPALSGSVAVSVDVNAIPKAAQEWHVTPLYEQQIEGVVLLFEQTSSLNGSNYVKIIEQHASADGADYLTLLQRRGTLVQAIPLQGRNSAMQTVYLATTPFPLFESEAKLYPGDVIPQANQINCENFELVALELPNDGYGTFVHVVTAGSVPPWLGGAVQRDVTAWVKYKVVDKVYTYDTDGNVTGTKGDGSVLIDHTINPAPISLPLLMTEIPGVDPVTGVPGYNFRQTAVSQWEEPLPTWTENGVEMTLAQHVFNQCSTLRYQGTLKLKEQEPTGLVTMGNVLNIVNGNPAWATMKGVVQSVSIDVTSGTTDVSFGAPKNLAVQDYIELLRMQRYRAVNVSQLTMATGGADIGTIQGSKDETGTGTYKGSLTHTPSTIVMSDFTQTDPNEQDPTKRSKKITLSVTDLQVDSTGKPEQAKMMNQTKCKDGTTKGLKALTTEDY